MCQAHEDFGQAAVRSTTAAFRPSLSFYRFIACAMSKTRIAELTKSQDDVYQERLFCGGLGLEATWRAPLKHPMRAEAISSSIS